ncbi:MAG TPA: PA14 domain-containing protein [Pirellulales bacterium]
MTEAFDPYRKWLGIPPEEQPPHHYRLLGVGTFEDDPDTIAIAADRQMAHLRTFQAGPHSALTQKLLNECAAARVCLLDLKRKAEYDRDLRARLAPRATPPPGARPRVVQPPAAPPAQAPPPLESSPVVPLMVETVTSARRPYSPRRKPAWQQPAVIAGVAAAAVATSVVLYLVNSGGQRESQKSGSPSRSATRTVAKVIDAPSRKPKETANPPNPQAMPPIADEPPDGSDTPDSPADSTEAGGEMTVPATSDIAAPSAAAADSLEPLEPPGPPVDATKQSETPKDTPAVERPPSLADLVGEAESEPPIVVEKKPPLPDPKELAAAEQQALVLIGDGPQKAIKLAEWRPWFKGLLERARSRVDDPEVQYVLMREAGRLAVARGDAVSACRALEVIAADYEVDDLLAHRAKLIEEAVRTVNDAELEWGNLLLTIPMARRAAEDEQPALAKELWARAIAAARKLKQRELAAQLTRERNALRTGEQRLQEYKRALATLKNQTDDAAAAQVAGRYEALVLGDWKAASAHWMAVSDAVLRDLVAREAEARQAPALRLAAAEAWWTAAEAAEKDWKIDYQLQAKYWRLRFAAVARASGTSPTSPADEALDVLGYPLNRLQPGLAAEYYNGGDFEDLKVRRVDRQIDWAYGERPPVAGVRIDHFSIRWSGWFLPPLAGKYRLSTEADDSMRLVIDGEPMLDYWNTTAGHKSIDMELSAEPHSVIFEHNEGLGVAWAEWHWALLDGGARGEQIVPPEALYHDPEAWEETAGIMRRP